MSVHFQSTKDNWRTPRPLLDALGTLKPLEYDPCPDLQCPDWVCREVPKTEFGGLVAEWPQDKHTYINPPYSVLKKGEWTEKILNHKGHTTVLVPARTDTKWWQALAEMASVTFLFKGRLKFHGAKNSAPFPSCLFCFNYAPTDLGLWSELLGAMPMEGVL